MKILNVFSQFKPCDVSIKKPYLIAEAGVNHEGSMDLAKRLIGEAAEGGADAIKFQTYKAETIAAKNSPAYWDTTKESTQSQFELFKKYDKFWKTEYEDLKNSCDSCGIEFISTPFDMESALFLNDLMDVFKISSSDITNRPFIEYICQFEKPIILSTGASYLHEVMEAVEWIEGYGNQLVLLHCVLNYPTKDENANLGMILDLRQHFPNKLVGCSDHTVPGDMKVLETATLLGARILEKHFTYDKTLPGNDHYHAMDKEDLKVFKQNLKRVFELLGSFHVVSLEVEQEARKNARRSLVTKCFIEKGRKVLTRDLTWKRPAHGISPKDINEVVGKRARVDLEEDSILQWSDLAPEG